MDEYLVVASHAFLTTKLGRVASSRTVGAVDDSSFLMYYTLVVSPQVVPDVLSFDSAAFAVGVGHVGSFKFDSGTFRCGAESSLTKAGSFQVGNVEAFGGSEGAAVFFEFDSDASHSMHGSDKFCKTKLVNFDSTRRL